MQVNIMKNQKLIIILTILFILIVVGITYYLKNVSSPEKLEIITKSENNLGFLYLLYVESDPFDSKTSTYDLKIYDPVTQEINQVSRIILPSNLGQPSPNPIQYMNRKLFYTANYPFAGGVIYALDLMTNKQYMVVNISASQDQNREIEKFIIDSEYSLNSILLLDCLNVPSNTSTFGKSVIDCQLKQTTLNAYEIGSTTILVNLTNTFKETGSSKSIGPYDSRRNSLILSEIYLERAYTAGIPYYYEVLLDGGEIKTLTEEEIAQISKDLGETELRRCYTSTLESGIFERERVVGVYPPQVRIGCVNLEELRFIE